MAAAVGNKYRNAGSSNIRDVTWYLTNEARLQDFAIGRWRPGADSFYVSFLTGLPVTNSHNVRSARLTFHIPHAGVLHGLAGYFEAVLYGDIGLSIHPHRKDQISKDMLSWFPLFFPLKVSSHAIFAI
jgi:hypothetical protein